MTEECDWDKGMTAKKKLIEVALPLEAINKESLHRKQKAPILSK